jgi:hypothetical protein
MANTRREYLKLLSDVEGPIQKEFYAYVEAVIESATIIGIEQAIQNNADVLRDLGITPGAMSGMNEAIRTAYLKGGQFEAPEARIVFDIRAPRAENWLRDKSSRFVTAITESQRRGIQVTLESNLRLGRGPRQTALDIVGRIGPTGRRSGGIIGLSGTQSEWVANAREQLLSGDKAQMRDYFNRVRRDRRFDGIVKRAIEEGRPVRVNDVNRITGRYADRLLVTRGEAIARSESIEALNAGRDEAVLQAIDEGKISADLTTGTWDATGDGRTRPDHAAMEGQKQPEGQPFIAPDGSLLRYPGDTSLGASAEMTINCRCFRHIEYDFIEAARAA